MKHFDVVSRLVVTLRYDIFGNRDYVIKSKDDEEGLCEVTGISNKLIDDMLLKHGLTTKHNDSNKDLLFVPIMALDKITLNGKFRYIKKGHKYSYSNEMYNKMNYKPKGTTKDGNVEEIKPNKEYVIQSGKWKALNPDKVTMYFSDEQMKFFKELDKTNRED